MPLTRPNLNRTHLTLDEQSFQGLLSAAFTIQEHNDQARKKAPPTLEQSPARDESDADSVCLHCGAVKPEKESPCQNCGLDQLRPGERLQRNWASMWLMSQQRGLWPERAAEADEGAEKPRQKTPQAIPPAANGRRTRPPLAPQSASNGLLGRPSARAATTVKLKKTESIRDQVLDPSPDASPVRSQERVSFDEPALDKREAQNEWTAEPSPNLALQDLPRQDLPRQDLPHEDLLGEQLDAEDSDNIVPSHEVQPLELSEGIDSSASEASADARSPWQRLADLRVTLHFHRADVYLGVSILVAVVAILWPAANSPRKPSLGLVDRALIAVGIAEAPAPVVHMQGDPGIEVWVDPHHALYYCPGEEQYGKTADGRFTSQRDAEMDSFEPAGRSACE
jgi:ribosomal protein L40E